MDRAANTYRRVESQEMHQLNLSDCEGVRDVVSTCTYSDLAKAWIVRAQKRTPNVYHFAQVDCDGRYG